MPLPAFLLILATLLPLLSFVVLVFVGKRMGDPLAGYVGTAALAGSFVCSLLAVALWLTPRTFVDPVRHTRISVGSGHNPVNIPIRWIPIGSTSGPAGIGQDHPGYLDVGIYVDSLTVAMFAMITTVATLVHIYSIGYMAGAERFARYFTYLSLLCFSMMGLVIGGTLLHILLFWGLIGLCSYLLIGLWHERTPDSTAAVNYFVVSRIGDVGFIAGMGILLCLVGNLSLPHVWGLLGDAGIGQAIRLPNGGALSNNMLTLIGIALFVGVVGRSAQFPLHICNVDAMAAPTPAAGLMNAATTMAAGVYLVGRLYPILTPDARLFIAVVGLLTLTLGALVACVQMNIKQVLAFSTVSQLGYMMLAIGVGSWVGGLFHLITHGFFKALLFLGAGSVIQAAHREQEMTEFGGLMRRIPVTAIAFGVGVLAIAGTPLMSAYYSKEMVLGHAAAFCTFAGVEGKSKLYWVFYMVPLGVAYVTAFYMARCWMLTFWGRPRNLRVYARAYEQPILYMPMLFLAVLSILGGKYLGVEELLNNSTKETAEYVRQIYPRFTGAGRAWPTQPPSPVEDGPEPTPSRALEALVRGQSMVMPLRSVGFYAFLGGIGAAFFFYRRGFVFARRWLRAPPLQWVHRWLVRRIYFDELYAAVFVSVTAALCSLAAFLHRLVIGALCDVAVRGITGIGRSRPEQPCLYRSVVIVAIASALVGTVFIVLFK